MRSRKAPPTQSFWRKSKAWVCKAFPVAAAGWVCCGKRSTRARERARKPLAISAAGRAGRRKGPAFCCRARNDAPPEPNRLVQERPGAGMASNLPSLRRLITANATKTSDLPGRVV